jgi:hypothetical protein
MKAATTLCIVCLLLLYGCSEDNMKVAITKMDVDFMWDLKQPQRSPEIHLRNTPKGTQRFHIV